MLYCTCRQQAQTGPGVVSVDGSSLELSEECLDWRWGAINPYGSGAAWNLGDSEMPLAPHWSWAKLGDTENPCTGQSWGCDWNNTSHVSDNAKSEVFLIIYLFMKCKQQHWKERDISLTQISCVAKYTAKEALLIILHETYLGFVYSLIRWVSLCFLSRAGAISFQNKDPFVCFLFVCFINFLLSIWVVLLHRQEVFPTFRKRK